MFEVLLLARARDCDGLRPEGVFGAGNKMAGAGTF
jgi:hypothetical protein